MFPAKVLSLRIATSIKIFFEDLAKVCKTFNWHFDQPEINKGCWKNNMVSIKEHEQYRSGRPKSFMVTYNIPSYIQPRIIGNHHEIKVTIPESYPAKLNEIKINQQTKLNHPRNHGNYLCIMVNGELDRVIMNLFNQLLWEPSFISGTVSSSSQYKNSRGNKERQRLLEEMKKRWGIN